MGTYNSDRILRYDTTLSALEVIHREHDIADSLS